MKLQIRTQIVDDCGREIIFCSYPLTLTVGTVKAQLGEATDHVYETLARNYLGSDLETDNHR